MIVGQSLKGRSFKFQQAPISFAKDGKENHRQESSTPENFKGLTYVFQWYRLSGSTPTTTDNPDHRERYNMNSTSILQKQNDVANKTT